MASTVNYVKFLRGTPTAYNKLTKKDPDTLYFISEKNATNGILYLGDKKIAGGDESLATLSLQDLENVFLSENIPIDSILAYDFASRKWINKSFSSLYYETVSIMRGASKNENGYSGLVPSPKKGQQNLFLKGDGTWASPTEKLEQDYTQLRKTLGVLLEVDSTLEGTPIASIKEIATGVLNEQLIPTNARDDLNSLKKIAEAIQNQPQINNDLNSRVTSLESQSKVLDKRVGNLEDTIFNSLQSLNNTTNRHTTEIKNLQERLDWKEFDIDTF